MERDLLVVPCVDKAHVPNLGHRICRPESLTPPPKCPSCHEMPLRKPWPPNGRCRCGWPSGCVMNYSEPISSLYIWQLAEWVLCK